MSLYGRVRLGQDVFLGEVIIPLRDVEETGQEVRRYTLGRRTAKEKVSGEINLACSWRVTPLDVVLLKVTSALLTPPHLSSMLGRTLCTCCLELFMVDLLSAASLGFLL